MNGNARDARGWRIALVPDALVNPQPAGASLPDVLGLLEANGYGLLQLPPRGEYRLLLAVIADQIAEYAHHGYAVIAIGLGGAPGHGLHWRRLSSLLRQRGAMPPLRHVIRPDGGAVQEKQRLAAVLAGHDLPQGEQRRWRV